MATSLVPGRVCGECNVCCSYYEITDPMLQKPKDTLCPMWQGGCTIHAIRPKTCREFFCLWRRTPSLDDGWRPDRLGVVIHETQAAIPAHFVQRVGLIFDICGAPEVIGDERLVLAIADQIHQGVPVFLRIVGAPGHEGAFAFLNDRMAQAVARRDRDALRAALREALADIEARSRAGAAQADIVRAQLRP
ncbi:MAG TPA: hypothetical protein VG387_14465 [Rhizomicrobium sp.]|jgi:hypothetical protein|nr:hypothetical protein [Rhizomicrobium sp.]